MSYSISLTNRYIDDNDRVIVNAEILETLVYGYASSDVRNIQTPYVTWSVSPSSTDVSIFDEANNYFYTGVIESEELSAIRLEIPNSVGTFILGASCYDDLVTPTASGDASYIIEVLPQFSSITVDDILNCEEPLSVITLQASSNVGELNPFEYMSWNIWATPDAGNSIEYVKDNNGDDYIFGATGTAQNIATINIGVRPAIASTFTLSPCLFQFQCTVISNGSEYSVVHDSTIEEFPPSGVLHSAFRINNEYIENFSDIYRVYNSASLSSATVGLSTPYDGVGSNVPDSYTGKVLASYDGSTVYVGDITNSDPLSSLADDLNTVTLNLTALSGDHVFSTVLSSVSSPTWLFSHTASSDVMTLHLVDEIPVADFIMWPEYTWFSESTEFHENSAHDGTLTRGVSAYGAGATISFFISSFSAHEEYIKNWYYESDVAALSTLNSKDLSGSQYYEKVFKTDNNSVNYISRLELNNDVLPSNMTKKHISDTSTVTSNPVINSADYLEYYDNIEETRSDNDEINFEHIKIKNLSSTGVSLVLTTDDTILFPLKDYVYGEIALTYDTMNLPVSVENSTRFDWNLTNGIWDSPQTSYEVSPNVRYNFTEGNGDDLLTVRPDVSTTMIMDNTATIKMHIPHWPYLWTPQDTIVHAGSAEIKVIPVIPSIFTFNKYVLTGTDVKTETLISHNSATLVGEITSVLWNNDCDSTSYYTNTGDSTFMPYITSFEDDGIYAVKMGVETVDGVITTACFSNVLYVLDEYNTYNPNITRVYGKTKLDLPYKTNVPMNDWCTAENVNNSFRNLKKNLDYIYDSAKMYDAPPTELYGWYGNSAKTGEHWHVNIDGIDDDYDNISESVNGRLVDVVDMVVKNNSLIVDNTIYLINDNKIQIFRDDYLMTMETERAIHSFGEPFGNLTAIGVDSRGRIVVTDSENNKVAIFKYDPTEDDVWRIIYNFGGFGGKHAKYNLNNPTDVFVDGNDYLYVVDSRNKAIKKYSATGSWISTFDTEDASSSIPLSVTVDNLDNIYVLFINNTVVKFDSDFNKLVSWSLITANNSIPKRIRISQDDGFVYICMNDKILKYEITGGYAGEIKPDLNSDEIEFTSVHHDDNRNLFVMNKTNIVMYIDALDIISVMEDNYSLMWPMSTIYVDQDEYEQDWVLNKSFARFWDNIELLRRSTIGKLVGHEVQLGISAVHVETFEPTEYKDFTYTKENIFIGINEFVANDVINRCFDQLYTCELELLDLIQD